MYQGSDLCKYNADYADKLVERDSASLPPLHVEGGRYASDFKTQVLGSGHDVGPWSGHDVGPWMLTCILLMCNVCPELFPDCSMLVPVLI